jgi:hypothetical protein
MRFINTLAILAATATALPVALPGNPEVVIWETVYETVYETASSKPTAAVVPNVNIAIPSTAEAVPTTSSAVTPIPTTTSVPTPVVPTTTAVPTTSAAPVSSSSDIWTSTTLAIPSTTSSGATATGSGIAIKNNLPTDVYLWVVTETEGEMQTLASGETFTDTWLTNSNGGGISIKMSTTEICDSVLQFEYTQSGEVLFWDLSSINLLKDSAIVAAGFGVTISDESCTTATCAAGDANCIESYQHPDDVNTLACKVDAAYTLTLG